MVLHATLSDTRAESYAFEGFTLEGCLNFTLQVTQPQLAGAVHLLLRGWLPQEQDDPPPGISALDLLPLRDTDQFVVGRHTPWWQDWVKHAEPDDPF